MQRFLQGIVVVLLTIVIGAPIALANSTTSPISTPHQEDVLTQAWAWPELGLNISYPTDWNYSLNQENFEWVLFSPQNEETGALSYITLQASRYDKATETLADVFATIAGESDLSETTFGGADAWTFDFIDQGQTTRFIGFGVNSSELALMGFSAPDVEWESTQSVYDTIIENATLEPLALDHAALNAQMQANYLETGSIGLGDSNAPVKVVEFMDFSCPHCANYTPSLARLTQDYVVDGQVYLEIVLLDIIGGEASQIASGAQVCAVELGIGYSVHEMLFDSLFTNGREGFTTEALTTLIGEADLGISSDDFADCLAARDFADFTTANNTYAASVDVNSTPILFFGTTGNDDLDFLRDPSGEAFRGAIPLVVVYEHLDRLLSSDEVDSE